MVKYEILNLVPRGNVERKINYNTKAVSFENGVTQYQRNWINPRVTFTFSTEGNNDMRKYVQDFFNARHGNYEPFIWSYDNKNYVCRFSENSLSFTEIYGYGGTGIVGYRCSFGLIKCRKSEYKVERIPNNIVVED